MEIFAQLAGRFGMHAGELAEVASFYSLLTLPPARAVFQVCTGLPCCLRGARHIVAELEHKFGIRRWRRHVRRPLRVLRRSNASVHARRRRWCRSI